MRKTLATVLCLLSCGGCDEASSRVDSDTVGVFDSTADAVASDAGLQGDAIAPAAPTVSIATPSQTIEEDQLQLAWKVSDDAVSCRWRIGMPPDATTGEVATSPAETRGFRPGDNTLFVGCANAVGRWGQDAIAVKYDPLPPAVEVFRVTQNGEGSPWSVDEFNDPVNWSPNVDVDGQIGPGDWVYFEQDITSQLWIRGSGNDKRSIVFDGSRAKLKGALVGLRGAISVYGQSYLRFQHFTIIGGGLDRGIGLYLKEHSATAPGHVDIVDCDVSNAYLGVWVVGAYHDIRVRQSFVHEIGDACFYAFNNDGAPPSFITVGGSPADGNVFRNCDHLDMAIECQEAYEQAIANGTCGGATGIDCRTVGIGGNCGAGNKPAVGYNANDCITSYNLIYADRDDYGSAGVEIWERKRHLIEHNTIYGLRRYASRSAITVKEDHGPPKRGEDIIIRYNHVYNLERVVRPWGGVRAGIHFGSDNKNVFVYGNYVHDADCGIRIFEETGGDTDGHDSENIYVFSNVVAKTEYYGIVYTGNTPDKFINTHIYNNTLVRTAYKGTSSTEQSIGSFLGAGTFVGALIENNVVVDSRLQAADRLSFDLPINNSVSIDYNHHYHLAGTPRVSYRGSACDPCEWDGETRPGDYGNNDSEGDPLLSDSSFAITSEESPLVNSGKNQGNDIIATLTIHGRNFEVRRSAALHPDTDWSAHPPRIVEADQDDFGPRWERGAYVYDGD